MKPDTEAMRGLWVDPVAVVFPVTPSLSRGGRGSFTRVASPCEFEFAEGRSPVLRLNYHPAGTGWLALMATAVTWLVASVVASASGAAAVGPGFVFWYWIVGALRRGRAEVDLGEAQKVVLDAERKEIGILAPIEGKQTWVGLKCRQHFDAIAMRLNASLRVPASYGSLRNTRPVSIVVLLILLVVLAAVELTRER